MCANLEVISSFATDIDKNHDFGPKIVGVFCLDFKGSENQHLDKVW